MKCPLPMKPAMSRDITTVFRSVFASARANSATSGSVVAAGINSTSFWTAGGL